MLGDGNVVLQQPAFESHLTKTQSDVWPQNGEVDLVPKVVNKLRLVIPDVSPEILFVPFYGRYKGCCAFGNRTKGGRRENRVQGSYVEVQISPFSTPYSVRNLDG